MGFCLLLLKYLKRKRGQKVIISLSIIIAFCLFGVLSAALRGFEYGVRQEGMDNFYVINAESSHASIPLSYLADIRAIPGVEKSSHASWVSGYVYEKTNPVSAFAVETSSYLNLNQEIQLTSVQKQAWLNNPMGAIVGHSLAQKYNWTEGSVIPLQSYLWKADNDTNSWPLTVVATYHLNDDGMQANKILLHYDYFDNINLLRPHKNLDAGYFILSLSQDIDNNLTRNAIDSLFENNKVKTKTVHAEEYLNSFVSRFMDIGKLFVFIVGIMLVTLWVVLSNLIFQSTLQRKMDFKVLHGIGVQIHTISALIITETVLLTTGSAAIGLFLSNYIIVAIKASVNGVMPAFSLTIGPISAAIGMAVLLGLFSCGFSHLWLKRHKFSTL